MRARAFADLITVRGGRPVVDHVPMLLSIDEANPDGRLHGHVAFTTRDRAGAERVLGGPIPAAWERFCK